MPESPIPHEQLLVWMLTRPTGRAGDGELTSNPTTRGENGTPFINWRTARAMRDRGWVRFLGRGEMQFVRVTPEGRDAAGRWAAEQEGVTS